MIEKLKSQYPLINFNSYGFFLVLFFLANCSYLLYLLLVGFYNIISVDDYCFMAAYKEHGLSGSLIYWYNNWQGRFSPQFFTNIFVRSYEKTGTLLPYTVLLCALFIFSIYRILKHLLPKDRPVKYYGFFIFNISLFLFNLFLIANFDFSSFYWICASTVYFAGLGFALLGMSEMLSGSKNIFSFLLIVLAFLYAGSSSESFSAICIGFLGLYLFYLLSKHEFKTCQLLKAKALVALFVCISAFLIMVTAPGNKIRMSYFPENSIFDASAIALKSWFDLVTKLLPEKVKYLCLLAFPFVYLGSLLRKDEKVNELNVSWIVMLSLPLLLIFFYFCVWPTAYAISGLGPLRSLTQVVFILITYVAAISFLIGYKTLFPRSLALVLSICVCIFLMLISRDRIRVNLPETIKYAQSEKARIKKLLSLRESGNKETVLLKPLYSSLNNALWFNEIGKDSSDINNYWINGCIREGLELGFDIELEEGKH